MSVFSGSKWNVQKVCYTRLHCNVYYYYYYYYTTEPLFICYQHYYVTFQRNHHRDSWTFLFVHKRINTFLEERVKPIVQLIAWKLNDMTLSDTRAPRVRFYG